MDSIRFMSAVLLLAYRRWHNVNLILDECRLAGISRIYIHIDGGFSELEKADVARTLQAASTYKTQWGIDIRIVAQKENIGCAVSMILSLNAILCDEEQLTVLEDDCVPTQDFFQFIQESFKEMEVNPRIALVCGAQFAPSSVTHNEWVLSRYPFNWGWGITKSQWALLSSKITKKAKLQNSGIRLSQEEITYWNAGSRRALDGYTDVWDTLLVREMIRHDSYSILPGVNLVRNVGNDENALHTHGVQLWTNFPTGSFSNYKSKLDVNVHFDEWVRSQFYGISKRHLVSTRVTWLRDYFLSRPKRKPLGERIQLAAVNFDA
jgi:hypothetical protein